MNLRNLFCKYLFYRWLFGSHSRYEDDCKPSYTTHRDFDGDTDWCLGCLGFDDDRDDFDLMDDDF